MAERSRFVQSRGPCPSAWWDGSQARGSEVGSESCAHHHRYTRRQLRGCPWRPASCLRAAPRDPKGRGVAWRGRLERRRGSGEGTGNAVRFRWSHGRELEKGTCERGWPACCQANLRNQGRCRGVAGLEVNGKESRWPERGSGCARRRTTGGTPEAGRGRRRQPILHRAESRRPCAPGPRTRACRCVPGDACPPK